jgi:hypothetical protein|nr:MAG TPA: hypothetical protein [Caudoviricetes sp.]
MRAMKHSHFPEQHYSDARTSTFAYFRAKLHKQGLNVRPSDASRNGAGEYLFQGHLVFLFHALMILFFDIMSRGILFSPHTKTFQQPLAAHPGCGSILMPNYAGLPAYRGVMPRNTPA